MIPFPAKKYEIIYADPPWAYNDKLGGLPKYGAMTYNTMTQDELAGLPIREITAKNCILFMWATMPKLQEALDTIKAWGFKYKTCAFCWVKQNPNGGGVLCRARSLGTGKRGTLPSGDEGIAPPRQQMRQADRLLAEAAAQPEAGRGARQDRRVNGRSSPHRTLRKIHRSRLGRLGQRSPGK